MNNIPHKPKIAIVGRMNVGKSTLFNRLAVDSQSMVFDYEGVTRDFVYDTVAWHNKSFQIVDTGGISLRKTTDQLTQQSREKVLNLIDESALCILVCDGTIGLVPEDREIATVLRKKGKTVILVVNKMDVALAQEQLHEFERLGFSHVIPVSAQHNRGINELLDVIVNLLPNSTDKKLEEQKVLKCRVALIGKPNVGKSSLINLLTKQERSLVSDIPGTTREAISERISFYQEDIQLTDTPGIRKKGAVTEPLENLMVKSSLRAIDAAHIVLLLVDAKESQLSDQELKLAFYIFEECKKGLIIIFNKQDLVDEEAKEILEYDLKRYKHLMNKVERLNISCKTEKNIGKVVPLIDKVWHRYSIQFEEEELSLLLKDALRRRPFYKQEQPLILHSVRQTYVAPITITLKVNMPEWFGESQLGYFENVLRSRYDLKGVPIKFMVTRKKESEE